MAHIVYLSIGSNLGDRLANLKKAVEAISKRIKPVAQSSVYETEPWGYSEQPTFFNMALKGETELSPQEVLSYLKEVETSLGRKESFRYGPRLIDLDILFYDDLIMDTPELTIPHARISERGFVLVPLAEIAPELRHPVLRESVAELRIAVNTSSIKLHDTAQSSSGAD